MPWSDYLGRVCIISNYLNVFTRVRVERLESFGVLIKTGQALAHIRTSCISIHRRHGISIDGLNILASFARKMIGLVKQLSLQQLVVLAIFSLRAEVLIPDARYCLLAALSQVAGNGGAIWGGQSDVLWNMTHLQEVVFFETLQFDVILQPLDPSFHSERIWSLWCRFFGILQFLRKLQWRYIIVRLRFNLLSIVFVLPFADTL